MRRFAYGLIVALALVVSANAQGWPPKNGSALPPSCAVGEGYFLTSDTSTQFYECTATNTWTHVLPAGGSGPTVVRVTADVTDTSITTWQDVTGLTKAVSSGVTYSFACFLTYTTAATTTALQLSVNGPAVTALDYGVEMSTTATARHNSAQVAYDTVVNPATGGGTTRLPATIHGSVTPSANGTLAIRMRTEIDTSAATVKRGSWCEFHTL